MTELWPESKLNACNRFGESQAIIASTYEARNTSDKHEEPAVASGQHRYRGLT